LTKKKRLNQKFKRAEKGLTIGLKTEGVCVGLFFDFEIFCAAKLKEAFQPYWRGKSLISIFTPPIARFFLAAHHARPAAFRAHKLALLVGRMGLFFHFDFAPTAEHRDSPFDWRTLRSIHLSKIIFASRTL
jgi:hypothetical protein